MCDCREEPNEELEDDEATSDGSPTGEDVLTPPPWMKEPGLPPPRD